MEVNNKTGLGLLPLPKDKRDFKQIDALGFIDITELPDEFVIGKPKVKNQGMTDLCTAYAITSASELQEGTELNPYYQFAKIKKIMGNPDEWGADLRSACKSAAEFGSLEEKDVPEAFKKYTPLSRNWNVWPIWCDEKAKIHQKKTYISIGGYGSIFKAIKAFLWQTKAKKRACIMGAVWRPEWTTAENGKIPQNYKKEGEPHAFIITGWTGNYLIAHLSNGEEVGDRGRFYFHKDIVEKAFNNNYGRFGLIDIDPEEVKKVCWSFWRRIWEKIKRYFNISFQ